MPSNPFTDLRQAKLAAVHCSPDKAAINELVPSFRIDFDVEPIASQEDISGANLESDQPPARFSLDPTLQLAII